MVFYQRLQLLSGGRVREGFLQSLLIPNSSNHFHASILILWAGPDMFYHLLLVPRPHSHLVLCHLFSDGILVAGKSRISQEVAVAIHKRGGLDQHGINRVKDSYEIYFGGRIGGLYSQSLGVKKKELIRTMFALEFLAGLLSDVKRQS